MEYKKYNKEEKRNYRYREFNKMRINIMGIMEAKKKGKGEIDWKDGQVFVLIGLSRLYYKIGQGQHIGQWTAVSERILKI